MYQERTCRDVTCKPLLHAPTRILATVTRKCVDDIVYNNNRFARGSDGVTTKNKVVHSSYELVTISNRSTYVFSF
jgi:hypothetical protein